MYGNMNVKLNQFIRENILKKYIYISFKVTFLFLYNINLLAETDLRDNSLLHLQCIS